MKLGTLKNGTRDGVLVIVDRTLSRCLRVPDIAPTLQAALDNWAKLSPLLEARSKELNAGKGHSEPFLPEQAMAPLPRSFQWADGSAYVNHVELVRRARGTELPASFWEDPLMYQGGSDVLLGARDPIPVISDDWGLDLEAEVGVITDDVPMGISPEKALDHIVLLVLVNDVSLRKLIPNELGKGFGFFQSKPATGFSPVAITPDELGEAWREGKVHLPLVSHINDQWLGHPNAGVDMTFNFPTLVAHAAKTRFLSAGTIIGSGTVSNRDRTLGSSCLVEKRMLEELEGAGTKTSFLTFGDRVRIEMFNANQESLFGAILQTVLKVEAGQNHRFLFQSTHE